MVAPFKQTGKIIGIDISYPFPNLICLKTGMLHQFPGCFHPDFRQEIGKCNLLCLLEQDGQVDRAYMKFLCHIIQGQLTIRIIIPYLRFRLVRKDCF